MKKILIVLIGLFTSCNEPDGQAISTTQDYRPPVYEFTYDGCQYVKFNEGNMTWGGHKGNCNNPIHKTQ